MKYIYVFVKNPSSEKMVKIDICSDYKEELNNLNEQLIYVGDTTTHFDVSAIFKVPDGILDSQKLAEVLQKLLPSLQYQHLPKTYYALSISDACNLLSALCEFSGFTSIDNQYVLFDAKQEEFEQPNNPDNKKPIVVKKNDNKINKEYAITLFKKNGFSLKSDSVSYKATDKKRSTYRIVFDYKMLKKNWYIILNDKRKKKLYLFLVPPMTLINEDFKLSSVQSSSTLYEMSISANNKDFIEKHTFISFTPYKISEIKYDLSGTATNKIDNSEKLSNSSKIIHSDLVSLKDATGRKLVSFYYKGQKFIVNSWRIMLDRVIEIAYAHDSEGLLNLAEKGLSPFQDGSKVWLTTDESIKKEYVDCHELYTTGIYYDVNLSRKYLCDFIKLIIRKCNLDINEFSVDYI